MPCGACAAGAAIQASRKANGQAYVFVGQPVTEAVPCEYDAAQLETWRKLLMCCKDKGIYLELNIPAHIINKFIGVTLSAINYNTNPCYFKQSLDEIAEFLPLLINTEKC